MNKRSLLFKVGLLLTILLVTAFPAQAKAVKTEVTGQSYFMGEIDHGVWTYPDGNVHIRGWVVFYLHEWNDPRLNGIETVVVNLNGQSALLPVSFAGPMWGTSRLENEGGYWDATWTGVRDEKGFAYIRGVAHGHAGYEGLKLIFEGSRLTPDYINDPFIWSDTIIDPRGE